MSVKKDPERRLAAAAALLALLFALIAIARTIFADPLGWFGVSGSVLLLLISLYWFALGRSHQRLLAGLLGLVSLILLIYLLVSAPRSNLWNVLDAVLLLAIASLAGKRALTAPTPAPPQAQHPDRRARFNNITLLINPKSGGGKAEKFDIIEKARALGIDVRVLQLGDDLQAMAREAAESGAEALAMGGGDGSLGLVAAVAMEYDLPFICIPVGTRNHFAMDIGLNRDDPTAALAAFGGEERYIDVAMVGDRVFLNNASFGVYAATLNEPGYREAKANAFRNVIASALNGEREPFDLSFDTPTGPREQAFIVFVGNNPYEFIGLQDVGGRRRLDQGSLQITVIEAGDHEALAKLAQGMIIGNPDFVADGLQQWSTTEFEIDNNTGTIDVGVDGEALSFPTPLTLRVKPRALRVLVPPGTPQEQVVSPLVFSPEALQKLRELVR